MGTEKKFTLIDTKTQIASWIILITGFIAVILVLITGLFEEDVALTCIVMIIILFIILIALIIYLLLQLQEAFQKNKGDIDPIEILNKRYAKGEISKEEYDEMKKEIQK